MTGGTVLAGDAPTPARPAGTWRAAATGWRVVVPVVLGNALIQGALVLTDPVPTADWGFAASVAASLAAALVMVWWVTCAASAAVAGRPRTAPTLIRHRPAVPVCTLAIAVLVIAGAVASPWLVPLLLAPGLFVLPAAAGGARNPLVAGFAPARRAPVRYAVAVLAFLLLAALSWLVALLLGLFVTGPVAAAATWIWFGVLLVIVQCWWCSLYRRFSW